MQLMMLLIIVVLVIAIIILIVDKYKIKEEKDNTIQNINISSNDNEIMDETLNLDELFKTISIKIIKNDSDFDFGLKNAKKNLNKN